jgi:hypothetical protein
MARVLDWSELRIRAVIAWARGVWEQTGTPARAGIVTLGLVAAGAAAYGMWWMTFGR